MMSEISTSQLLLIVNAYVLLALMMFAMSVGALVCRLWEGCWCTKKLRSLKFLIAICPEYILSYPLSWCPDWCAAEAVSRKVMDVSQEPVFWPTGITESFY